MDQRFAKEKNLNITLNFAGESAIGCVMAREYLNMQDDLLIYGVDDMDDTVKMIKEGKIAGSIVTSFIVTDMIPWRCYMSM